MKARLWALACGLLFGVGLLLSGMTSPAKVLGFLDVTGDWDPSLALVMVGAIGVHAVLVRVILRREQPLLTGRFDLPAQRGLDGRLIGGALLFGVGWGLAGYCPGPALVGVGGGALTALVFGAAMGVGMVIHRLTVR